MVCFQNVGIEKMIDRFISIKVELLDVVIQVMSLIASICVQVF